MDRVQVINKMEEIYRKRKDPQYVRYITKKYHPEFINDIEDIVLGTPVGEQESKQIDLTPAKKQEIELETQDRADLVNKAKQYKSLVDEYGFESNIASPEIAGKMEGLRSDILARIKKAETLGTLDKGLLDFADMLLGVKPTGPLAPIRNIGGSGSAKVSSQIGQLISSEEQKIQTNKSILGEPAEQEELTFNSPQEVEKWLQENQNDPQYEIVKQSYEEKKKTMGATTGENQIQGGEEKTLMGEIGETLKDRFSNIFNIVQGKRVKTGEDINTIFHEKALQTIGQLATIPFDIIGDVFEVSYDKLPQEDKAKIEQGFKTLAETEAGKKGLEALGQGVEAYNEWATKNPRLAQNVEGVVNVVGSLTGTKIGKEIGKPLVEGMSQSVKSATKGVVELGGEALSKTGEAIGEVAPGATRIAQEYGSRIPRFFKHRAEDLEDANVRAKFIEDAPLAKQNDLKESFNVNLDRNLMITATESDDITKEELRRIVQMAEDPKTPNPNLVAGQAAEKQYDFIISKQEEVGKKIGDLEKSLPDMRVNMKPSMENLAKTLLENEISIEKGKVIAPNLTNSQKLAVKELLTLIKQRGESLTPTQIHKADQLFSNLQREKRMDKVSEIYIDVNGERKNLFSTIRELYTGELDKISSFRNLNKEYRKYATLQDDLEKTIFSGGKAEVTKGMDPQEFAKTNLRRAFGEAQSSATYKELADILDKEARELGYEGASPLVLTDFAERLRKLYPETIPTTGFQGGIQTGVGAAIEATLKAGGPKSTDQVKALKRLLDMDDLKGKGELLPTTIKGGAVDDELITIYRGQDESEFSLEPRKGKMHNMSGTSFAKRKETAEVYSMSGTGLNPTVIEGTIPKSKIMTFDEFSPRMKERFKKEIDQMDDDDIISGELIENLMDEAIPTAKALGKEAIDMNGFTRGLVDEIRVMDSAKSFKITSKTDRSDLLERFKAKSKLEEKANK